VEDPEVRDTQRDLSSHVVVRRAGELEEAGREVVAAFFALEKPARGVVLDTIAKLTRLLEKEEDSERDAGPPDPVP